MHFPKRVWLLGGCGPLDGVSSAVMPTIKTILGPEASSSYDNF